MRSVSAFLGCGALVVTLAGVDLPAQTPPPAGQAGQQTGQRGGGAAGQPGQPAQPGQRGGGGGRGRGGIVVMTLTTTGWTDGGEIPIKYAQPGAEVSPPLAWSGAPDMTASLVVIVHDIDAGVANQTNATDDVLHWLVWNIPATSKGLAEAMPQGPQLPDGTRQISQTGPYYRGPGAPATGPAHHYVFEVYALDAMIDVPPVGQSPALTRAAVVAAMATHVRGRAALVGTFKHAQ